MNVTLFLCVAVCLVGLIAMCIKQRWAEIFYICFAMGLLATLLKFAGIASLTVHN